MNRRRRSTTFVVLLTAALLAACAGDTTTEGTGDSLSPPAATTAAPAASTGDTNGDTTPGTRPTDSGEGSTTPMSSEAIDPGLQPYIDIAVADLAQRLSVDAAQITVTSATLQQWPDASLGCPQPGMQYAQVETDGALIVLNAGGKAYDYHAGGSRTPFLCSPAVKDTSTSGG